MTEIKKDSPRRREIMEKTLDIVQEGGLGCVTIKKIANRVGFSEPAVYRHFRNKNALLLGLMDLLEEMLIVPAEAIAGDKTLSAIDRMLGIVRHHTGLILKYNSLPVLLFAEASVSNDPAMTQRMSNLLKEYMSVIRGVIDQGQKNNEISHEINAECLVLMLMGSPAALAIRHRLLPDSVLEERVKEHLMPFVVRQMKADARRS